MGWFLVYIEEATVQLLNVEKLIASESESFQITVADSWLLVAPGTWFQCALVDEAAGEPHEPLGQSPTNDPVFGRARADESPTRGGSGFGLSL
jgi:hypothetical protein